MGHESLKLQFLVMQDMRRNHMFTEVGLHIHFSSSGLLLKKKKIKSLEHLNIGNIRIIEKQ